MELVDWNSGLDWNGIKRLNINRIIWACPTFELKAQLLSPFETGRERDYTDSLDGSILFLNSKDLRT